MWLLEPHVAEKIFDAWIEEAQVKVDRGAAATGVCRPCRMKSCGSGSLPMVRCLEWRNKHIFVEGNASASNTLIYLAFSSALLKTDRECETLVADPCYSWLGGSESLSLYHRLQPAEILLKEPSHETSGVF